MTNVEAKIPLTAVSKIDGRTYNKGLELKAENFKCDGPGTPVPLKVNRYFKEVARSEGKDEYSRALFNPKHTKIGCSKEKTCSNTIEAGENAGKTIEIWGVCFLGPSSDYHFDASNTPEKNGMPTYEKYGDLLGVVGSSGRFFSLTLFLVSILAFYF
ncbi:hypothetical protein L3Y34_000366 [Caenorhabditis briggsae]|uniref:Uncharacterized protein n=1 Tax=Caenorhabditis briggsae TaxID=6238 RepID=A0AAE9D9C2_CAEBR|nr:hypothetical protein L3Y34_000366 [Caenorhabditis briggsae]